MKFLSERAVMIFKGIGSAIVGIGTFIAAIIGIKKNIHVNDGTGEKKESIFSIKNLKDIYEKNSFNTHDDLHGGV